MTLAGLSKKPLIPVQTQLVTLVQQMFSAFLIAPNQHAPNYAVAREQCLVLSTSNSKKARQGQQSENCQLLEHIDMGSITGTDACEFSRDTGARTPVVHCSEPSGHEPSMVAEDSEF
ncbi:hypothetical protein BGX24_007895 [Mortierella sp. AD032]|nr:hypothetical protein BGX24_007895 [Mortierella sp. AD032]